MQSLHPQRKRSFDSTNSSYVGRRLTTTNISLTEGTKGDLWCKRVCSSIPLFLKCGVTATSTLYDYVSRNQSPCLEMTSYIANSYGEASNMVGLPEVLRGSFTSAHNIPPKTCNEHFNMGLQGKWSELPRVVGSMPLLSLLQHLYLLCPIQSLLLLEV